MNIDRYERQRLRSLVVDFSRSCNQMAEFEQIGSHPRQHAEFINQMNNLTACPDPIGLYRDLWADYQDCWDETETPEWAKKDESTHHRTG